MKKKPTSRNQSRVQKQTPAAANAAATLAQLLQTALQQHQQGQLKQASQGYESILQRWPEQPDALHYLGVLAQQEGDAPRAEELIRRAIAVHPLPVMWKNLSAVLQSVGRTEESLQALYQAWQLAPEDLQAGLDVAAAHIERQQWRDAQRVLEQLLTHAPDWAVGLLNLGNCHKNLGDKAAAEACYKRALALAPDMPEVYSNYGALMAETDRAAESIALHERAVALRPDVGHFAYNLGNAYWSAGRRGDALTAFEKAAALDPTSINAVMNLATALQAAGQLDQALAMWRRAEAIDPNKAQIYSNIGSLCLDVRRYEEALAYLRRALTLDPNAFNAWTTASHVLLQLGRLDDARTAVMNALSIESKNGMAWMHLATTELRANRPQAARRALQAALVRPEGLGMAANTADQRAGAALRLANLMGVEGDVVSARSMWEQAVTLLRERYPWVFRLPTEPAARRLVLLRPIGRAGSLFLHSLIDSHPQISTLPGVIAKGFFGAQVWESLCPTFDHPQWREILVERFCLRYAVLLDAESTLPVPGNPFGRALDVGKQSGLTTLGAKRDQVLRLDAEHFKSLLLAQLQPLAGVSAPRFFELIHDCWDSIHGQTPNKPVIFFHIHNPGEMELGACLQGFDDVLLLAIVREPLQAVESWLKLVFESVDQETAPDYVLLAWHDAVGRLEATISAASDATNDLFPSAVLRLEDLKKNTQVTLERLMERFGVAMDACLYQSTFAGLEYDAPASTPVKGFETSNLDRKPGALFSEHDQRVMNLLLYPIAVQYGYREADAAYLEHEIAWYKPLISEPLDFEKKILAQLAAMGYQKDVSGPRRHFESIAQRCIHLLEKFGTYPAMAPWLKVD